MDMQVSMNRFDMLRLVFAGLVFVYHAIALPGLWAKMPIELVFGEIAELAIQGFFVISGALVYGSLMRSKGLADYAGKRLRRLYPAYIVVVLVPAFVALALTPAAIKSVGAYVGANLIFLNFLAPDLPGFFDGQRFAAVNGALWTLKIEVMFYLVLPILGWLVALAGRWKWVLLGSIYVAAEAWRAYWLAGHGGYDLAIARQLPGQMSFFVVGMVMWLMWDRLKPAPWGLFWGGVVILALTVWSDALIPLRGIGLGLVIAALAFGRGPQVNAARYGDVSYGLYIIHFPIVQTFIAAGVFAFHPALGLAASFIIVLALSFAMWHHVEKRALRQSSHYRQAAQTP